MFVRSPLALVAFLALAVCAITVPEGSSGLLLLTPALAFVLPLLFNSYPGEKSVARLASWFARLSLPAASAVPTIPLFNESFFSASAGFCGANAGRGPPSFSLN
jgi:hypothetical protein